MGLVATPSLCAWLEASGSCSFGGVEAGCRGEKIDDGGLEMWLPQEAVEKAEKLWQENFAPDQQVVAFNIGASWETKRWLDSYFAQCADELIEKGYAVAFFGGSMDIEMVDKCRKLMKQGNSPLIKVFTGKVSLAELGALLRKCALFLTTDSGPMHVGVSQHVPVVTMFGASPVPGFIPMMAGMCSSRRQLAVTLVAYINVLTLGRLIWLV